MSLVRGVIGFSWFNYTVWGLWHFRDKWYLILIDLLFEILQFQQFSCCHRWTILLALDKKVCAKYVVTKHLGSIMEFPVAMVVEGFSREAYEGSWKIFVFFCGLINLIQKVFQEFGVYLQRKWYLYCWCDETESVSGLQI